MSLTCTHSNTAPTPHTKYCSSGNLFYLNIHNLSVLILSIILLLIIVYCTVYNCYYYHYYYIMCMRGYLVMGADTLKGLKWHDN